MILVWLFDYSPETLRDSANLRISETFDINHVFVCKDIKFIGWFVVMQFRCGGLFRRRENQYEVNYVERTSECEIVRHPPDDSVVEFICVTNVTGHGNTDPYLLFIPNGHDNVQDVELTITLTTTCIHYIGNCERTKRKDQIQTVIQKETDILDVQSDWLRRWSVVSDTEVRNTEDKRLLLSKWKTQSNIVFEICPILYQALLDIWRNGEKWTNHLLPITYPYIP